MKKISARRFSEKFIYGAGGRGYEIFSTAAVTQDKFFCTGGRVRANKRPVLRAKKRDTTNPTPAANDKISNFKQRKINVFSVVRRRKRGHDWSRNFTTVQKGKISGAGSASAEGYFGT